MMKLEDTIIRLPESLMSKLVQRTTPMVYGVDQEIFYEGQTPIVAYLLLDGEIKFVRNRKVRLVVEKGFLIGLPELLMHSPFESTAIIAEQSKVCFLDKSTIFEMMAGDDNELSVFLSEASQLL